MIGKDFLSGEEKVKRIMDKDLSKLSEYMKGEGINEKLTDHSKDGKI